MGQTPPMISLATDELTVEIAPLGAELMSLRDAGAREWLWQGDAASWPRRAPLLFPVVGRCAGGVLRHRGRTYPMTGHGFAPNGVFTRPSQAADRCLLRLVSDEQTRASYPFDFQLDVAFRVDGNKLCQTATVTNTGPDIMPASIGFHPGFQWPLPSVADGTPQKHVVLFAGDEPAPVKRLEGHLLSASRFPSPVEGRCLALSHGLFAMGAVIFDRLASRSLWFGVPGSPGVQIDFPDLPHLGLWMLPGARFLCIEPWQGHACPEGFEGEILAKPGMIHLAPGASFSRRLEITVGVPPRSA